MERQPAIVRLYNQVFSNADRLPPGTGVGQPLIKPKGIDDVPILALTANVFIPYGFAWTRRVTEEGNDLNRNYVDHSKPYPVNEGYLEIADYLVPPDLSEAGMKAADAHLAAYRKKVVKAGGKIHVEEQKVPGMGKFSLFMDPEEIGRVLASQPGVVEVHAPKGVQPDRCMPVFM